MISVLFSVSCTPFSKQISLTDVYSHLKTRQFVDLTHSFEPGIPHWPGFPDEKRETIYWYEKGRGTMGSGFYAQKFSLVGQWGTHVDPPAHFVKGLRTVDQINLKEMILPLVVIDVSEKTARNPDYTITMKDVLSWESKHGVIPKEAFVAMRTDWSKRWLDIKSMRNEDDNGTAHYPGWSQDVLKYLYEKSKITASGHETMDTDPDIATSKGDYSLETYILQTNNITRSNYWLTWTRSLRQVPWLWSLFQNPKTVPVFRHAFSQFSLRALASLSRG